MTVLYDKTGVGYANLRKPDPRIAKAIHAALGDAQTVLNVGAGTGSYEPTDREVTALEPSAEMIASDRKRQAKPIRAWPRTCRSKTNSLMPRWRC